MSLWQKKSAVSAANEWSLNSLLQPVQAEIIPFNKLDSNCIDPVSVVLSSNAGELALTRLLALFIGSCDSLAPCISFTCVFTRTHPSVDLFLLVTGAFLLSFVALQINAQDIYYQEQLGHGNGGTVYKWVGVATLPRLLTVLSIYPSFFLVWHQSDWFYLFLHLFILAWRLQTYTILIWGCTCRQWA